MLVSARPHDFPCVEAEHVHQALRGASTLFMLLDSFSPTFRIVTSGVPPADGDGDGGPVDRSDVARRCRPVGPAVGGGVASASLSVRA